MQTLKDVKREMYENMKNRYNDFLSEEERYIVENLHSVEDPDYDTIQYTEDEACNLVCQSLDWLCMNDTENACWEAWYIRWYEVALKELSLYLEEWKTIQDVILKLDYLLTK